jgi:hypothetical protein
LDEERLEDVADGIRAEENVDVGEKLGALLTSNNVFEEAEFLIIRKK